MGYIHGFSREEQDRLYDQARFLEPRIYDNVSYPERSSIVEIGCGVGAQTSILLERFPSLSITGMDASEAQLDRAREHLAKTPAGGRVQLVQGDALAMPFAENQFDGAFLCWVLEHVPDPRKALQEVRRVIRPGGRVFCTEVLNATFFLEPYSPATQRYWFSFNDHQWNLRGDPFVGAKLGNLFLETGFQKITTEVKSFHFDSRTPKTRALMIDFWTRILLSGTPALLEAGRTSDEEVKEMRAELERVKHDRDGVFFYACVQASGEAW